MGRRFHKVTPEQIRRQDAKVAKERERQMAQRLRGVYEAIEDERAYQDRKWGTIQDHPHTVAEWLLILESELAEAKQAWVKGDGATAALREVVQVAAVAFACLEQHGAIARDPEDFHALDAGGEHGK